jgi:hypothetical protein
MTVHATRRIVMLATVILALGGCASASPPAAPSDAASLPAEPSTGASEAAVSEAIDVSFTGTLPDGWVEGDNGIPTPDSESAFLELSQNQAVMAADCSFGPEDGAGTTADGIASALGDRDGLVVAAQADAEVGGLSGVQLDFAAAADGTGATCDSTYVPLLGAFASNGDWLFIGAGSGETNRLVILDVPGGGNIVIWVYANEPESVDDYLDAAAEVMSGLEFDLP